MASIAESAKAYEAPQTRNIVELDKVSTASDITSKTFKEGTDDEFTINLINVDGSEFRIPNSVLATLKEILSAKPDLEFFKVTKTGTDLNTRYTVIPL